MFESIRVKSTKIAYAAHKSTGMTLRSQHIVGMPFLFLEQSITR